MIDRIRGTLARYDVHIYRVPPRGLSLQSDVTRWLPDFQVRQIFDVGAHIGEAARVYSRAYPTAAMTCFEPNPTAFQQLSEGFKSNQAVTCENLACGSANGEAVFNVTTNPTMSHIRGSNVLPSDVAVSSTRTVKVVTLDTYAQARGISTIDLLKIDTEGHDMEVLEGAANLLDQHRIGLVQAEVALIPENKFQVPFERIKQRMEDSGYRLFGLYEQLPYPALSHRVPFFANAAFIPNPV